MLVSVSGSQGLGKSVFINHLATEWRFKTIERKTSRSILSDWGVSLSEVNNDRELTTKFQDEILTRKAADEAEAAVSDELWVTERSFADLFTYAVVALGKDNEYSDWVDRYYDRCVEAQKAYAGVMYLDRSGRFDGKIVADGVRGINAHYGIMVDLTMTHYSNEICDMSGTPLWHCYDSTPEDRANFLQTNLIGRSQRDQKLRRAIANAATSLNTVHHG